MKQFSRLVIGLALLCLGAAAPAAAQYNAPKMGGSNGGSTLATGERYHIQVAGGLWNPTPAGVVTSEQFGLIGTKIDFVKDFKFQQTRFKDLRLELRATRRNKLYAQYTPISFSSDTTFTREIIFNGQKYPLNLPVQTTFDWKVWRIGYELDIIALPRGFMGVTVEGRLTEFGAGIRAPGFQPEFTKAKGPLPSVGGIVRVYPLKMASITASVTGFKVPDVSPDYAGNYFDWDIYGTINVNDYVGLQGGWRRVSTTVTIKKDFGDMKFQGIWFGAVARF